MWEKIPANHIFDNNNKELLKFSKKRTQKIGEGFECLFTKDMVSTWKDAQSQSLDPENIN